MVLFSKLRLEALCEAKVKNCLNVLFLWSAQVLRRVYDDVVVELGFSGDPPARPVCITCSNVPRVSHQDSHSLALS